jgi:uncharacterized protein
MRIPTDDDILRLHEKHAPTPRAFDLVYTHCVIVCGIAEQLHSRMGAAQGIDIDLTRAGALLHDVGVYRLYDAAGNLDRKNYIRHGILGYELLQEEGLPEAICRFASHHTGVGLTASVSRFGPQKVAAFQAMRAAFGEPDLEPFSAAYGHRIIHD